ncbi:MAG: LD-carboxypeptidase, partial [Bacteroidota bacterium]
KNGYNAGTDQQRLDDLHSMFRDLNVKAVWCVRGGYGCTRLLPMIDYELIRNNPKILIGYSDITALCNIIFQKTGLVTFHGPVASSTFEDYSIKAIQKVLMEAKPMNIQLNNHPNKIPTVDCQPFTLKAGETSGVLAGGNLSLLAAMVGTPYEVDLNNKLVFIEEIGEKPYRIDRMLTQLRQSGSFKNVKGIVMGIFNDCNPEPEDESLSLKQCLVDRLKTIDVPIQYGYAFGHIRHQFVLPVGINAQLNTLKNSLLLTETAVS